MTQVAPHSILFKRETQLSKGLKVAFLWFADREGSPEPKANMLVFTDGRGTQFSFHGDDEDAKKLADLFAEATSAEAFDAERLLKWADTLTAEDFEPVDLP